MMFGLATFGFSLVLLVSGLAVLISFVGLAVLGWNVLQSRVVYGHLPRGRTPSRSWLVDWLAGDPLISLAESGSWGIAERTRAVVEQTGEIFRFYSMWGEPRVMVSNLDAAKDVMVWWSESLSPVAIDVGVCNWLTTILVVYRVGGRIRVRCGLSHR